MERDRSLSRIARDFEELDLGEPQMRIEPVESKKKPAAASGSFGGVAGKGMTGSFFKAWEEGHL